MTLQTPRYLATGGAANVDGTTSLYSDHAATQAKPSDGTATGTGVFDCRGISHALLHVNIGATKTATITLHGYVEVVGRWCRLTGWGVNGSYSIAAGDDVGLPVDCLGWDKVCVAIDSIDASAALYIDTTLSQESPK